MAAVARLGDNCTGHGCWPARPSVAGSGNVSINGIKALRVGDDYASHTCPTIPQTHDGSQAVGSSSVTVNKKSLARIGDGVSCGGSLAQGSPNVTAGG